MNRVSLPMASFDYIRYLSAEPRMKFIDGKRSEEPELSPEQIPIYSITCLAKAHEASKPETINIKVPMETEPNIPELAQVAFAGLSAYAYAIGDRAALSFSAERMATAEKAAAKTRE